MLRNTQEISLAETDSSFVYREISDELQRLGVTHAFGLLGDDVALLTTDLVERCGINYQGARHESVATLMASGYAWATAMLGICLVTRGPGLLNCCSALLAAVKTARSVLVITGDAPTRGGKGGPDLKAVDAENLFRAAGVAYFRVTEPNSAAIAVQAAALNALSGQPTILAVPTDVMHASVAKQLIERPGQVKTPERPLLDLTTLEQLAKLLCAAERPLILAGRGACDPATKSLLQELAERSGALLGTSLLGKDLFRGHRLDLGVVGGFATEAARAILAEVDFVIAFGASLNSYTSGHGTLFRGKPIAQIDIVPSHLNRFSAVDISLNADAREAAQALMKLVPVRSKHAPLHEEPLLRTLEWPPAVSDESRPGELDPRALVLALQDMLPEKASVVLDSGHFISYPGAYLRVCDPSRFRMTTEFSCVGQGLGTALGVSAARPQSSTVLFIGDGGLLMTLGDLETVARLQPSLIMIVMDDGAYGAERHILDLWGASHSQAQFSTSDFASLAEAFGIESLSITSLDELSLHTDKVRHVTGPLLLDCKIRGDLRAPWVEEFVNPAG